MTPLPDNVIPYRTIGPFTQDTLPAGLLKEHNTKAGVWGQLEVESGSVRYLITEPGQEATEVLSPNRGGVIVPQQKHHLELMGPVSLKITFLRASNT